MLLFFTRDARCNLSIEDRRVGDGEDSLPAKRFSELNRLGVDGPSRPCQKSRGDDVPSGELWNGDESVLRTIFCEPILAQEISDQPLGISTYLGSLVVTGRVSPLLGRRKLRKSPW